jgi:hypothetical protein
MSASAWTIFSVRDASSAPDRRALLLRNRMRLFTVWIRNLLDTGRPWNYLCTALTRTTPAGNLSAEGLLIYPKASGSKLKYTIIVRRGYDRMFYSAVCEKYEDDISMLPAPLA